MHCVGRTITEPAVSHSTAGQFRKRSRTGRGVQMGVQSSLLTLVMPEEVPVDFRKIS
jgi:hypothetical protein